MVRVGHHSTGIDFFTILRPDEKVIANISASDKLDDNGKGMSIKDILCCHVKVAECVSSGESS